MPDHIHLAISVPPKIAISEFVRLIKGNSSHFVNHSLKESVQGSFAWQSEYGVITFGGRSLKSVVAYVENQAQHHANDDLWPIFEVGDFDELNRGNRSIYRPGSNTTSFDTRGTDSSQVDRSISASKRLRRD
jgi:hypothetical protein